MSDQSRGPGWWVASDGKWYAPEQHPDYVPTQPPPESAQAKDLEERLELLAQMTAFRLSDLQHRVAALEAAQAETPWSRAAQSPRRGSRP